MASEAIKAYEGRQRSLARDKPGSSPTMVFSFQPGQMVLRRWRPFSKMDAKASGPVIIDRVYGLYNQRVVVKWKDSQGKWRKNHVHASQLIPIDDPFVEP